LKILWYKTTLLFFLFVLFFLSPFYSQESISQPDKKDSLQVYHDRSIRENYSRSRLLSANFENITDFLVLVPGFYANVLGNPGQFASIGYLSSGRKNVSLSIDGIPLYSSLFGMWDLQLVPLPLTESVSIRHWYAPGVVNFYTEDVSVDFETPQLFNSQPLTSIIYRKGDYERSDVSVLFRRRISRVSGMGLFAQYRSFPGKFGHDQYDQKTFWGSYEHRLRKFWSLKISALINRKKNSIPGYEQNWNTRIHNNRKLFWVKLSRSYNDMLPIFSFFGFFSEYDGIYRTFSTDKTYKSKEKNFGGGFNLHYYQPFGTLYINTNYTWYDLNGTDESFHIPESTYSLHINGGIDLKEMNRFVISLNTSLTRFWDRPNFNKSTFNVCYNAMSNVYLGYRMTAGDRPFDDLMEQSGESVILFIGGKPQTIFLSKPSKDFIRSEIYLKREDSHFISGNLSLYYETDYSGIISSVKSDICNYCSVSAVLNYIRPRDGKACIYSPELYGNIRVIFRNLNKLFINYPLQTDLIFTGIFLNKYPVRYYLPFSREFIIDNKAEKNSGFFLNIKGQVTIRTLSLFYEMDNVLNRQFEAVYSYPFPGRVIRLGLQWEFTD